MSEATPQEVRDEFIEEFYQHMLKSTPVLTSFERASLKLKLHSLLKSHEEKILERVRKILVCSECGGSGAYSTPSDYSPCDFCSGSGLTELDGNMNDVLQTLESKNE